MMGQNAFGVFLVVIYAIGGWLVIIPALAFVMSVIVGLITQRRIGKRVAASMLTVNAVSWASAIMSRISGAIQDMACAFRTASPRARTSRKQSGPIVKCQTQGSRQPSRMRSRNAWPAHRVAFGCSTSARMN